jgi:hypothetical protein
LNIGGVAVLIPGVFWLVICVCGLLATGICIDGLVATGICDLPMKSNGFGADAPVLAAVVPVLDDVVAPVLKSGDEAGLAADPAPAGAPYFRAAAVRAWLPLLA